MEDEKIIDLFWSRSELDIKETDNKYGCLCKHIALNILKNNEDADECVNSAYLNLWNSIPPERPRSLIAYIGRIVRNIAINRYRHNNAKKRNKSIEVLLSELDDCIPSVDVYTSEDSELIARTINAFLYTLDD